MAPIVRFAPSPTGKLHLGNIRLMLANWLFARQSDGTFILRLDDTDAERSTKAFENGILQDLDWLGVNHDQVYRQSDRDNIYATAIAKLKAAGRLYPCYETREELDMKRKLQLAAGRPPRYDRGALEVSADQRAAYEAQGRQPHWRLHLTDDIVSWTDMIHGPLSFEGAQLSDPVLIREDGGLIYALCSVVDDLDMGITHVIRGDDHITNTAVQIQLIQALGHAADTFTYGHLPLLTTADGSGLSKRFGSLSVESLREEGFLPLAINSLLATLGTCEAIHLAPDITALIAQFDMKHVNKSSAKISMDDLRALNKQALQRLSFDEAAPIAAAFSPGEITPDFWMLVRDNIQTLQDIAPWWDCIYGDIQSPSADPEYMAQALACLPATPWDETTWKAWTAHLKAETGRKGAALFMPLRQALTGQDHGPEMAKLLLLIGPTRAQQRLHAARAPAS